MTSARATKIDLHITPYYHCVSRCVRRSFLCGIDLSTGQDYSHRKIWILDKFKFLVNIFAIEICAYAIMTNHYHLVLFIDQKTALSWSDQEVFTRWTLLFPNDARRHKELGLNSEAGKEKLRIWRQRLMSISWFMRRINQSIANAANAEDDCTGHFWESRFKSQAILDEGALLATMAYVDLNPIRAKEALTPETSEFTSIYQRIQAIKTSIKSESCSSKISATPIENQVDKAKQPTNLMPFMSETQKTTDAQTHGIAFKLSDYLALVDATGRILREDKRGCMPESLAPILIRLKFSDQGWLSMVKNLGNRFFTGIGNENALMRFRSRYRRHRPKGSGMAKRCYLPAA